MKVLIVDDHPLFRAGLAQTVRDVFSDVQVWEASGVEDGLAVCQVQADMDLLLLDLTLPGQHGLDGLSTFRRLHPAMPVVLITGAQSVDFVREGRAKGAQGFVFKDASAQQMRDAIGRVLEGQLSFPQGTDTSKRMALSPRQMEVLSKLAQGLPNKQIARELGIGDYTVRSHMSRIFQILQARTRTEAVVLARRHGLL